MAGVELIQSGQELVDAGKAPVAEIEQIQISEVVQESADVLLFPCVVGYALYKQDIPVFGPFRGGFSVFSQIIRNKAVKALPGFSAGYLEFPGGCAADNEALADYTLHWHSRVNFIVEISMRVHSTVECVPAGELRTVRGGDGEPRG